MYITDKLKLASLKNNPLEGYSNTIQLMNTTAGLKLLAVTALPDQHVFKCFQKYHIKQTLDTGLVSPPVNVTSH